MKHKPIALKQQRNALDQKLRPLLNSNLIERPRAGWIKAIRESLGITRIQLAHRLGISSAALAKIENNEKLRTASLETLEKAARAMNCKFVYAMIPEDSLESMVDKQAMKAAQKLAKRVAHSMALEKQGVEPSELDMKIQEIADELKEKMNSKMWDEK